MRISSISFDNKKYKLSDTNISSEENTFTILVGRNGSGKSRILQRICHIYLNSLNNNPHGFYNINKLNSYNNINNTTDLNCGEIIYEQNNNIYEISSTQLRGLHNSYNDYYVLEKKNKTSQSENFVDITKIIAVSTSPFDKFPIIERHMHWNNAIYEKNYIYRGGKIKANSQKDYLKNKFDQLGASLINFFLRSDRTQDKTSILLEAINLDEKINMYFSFPWPFSPSEIINNKNPKPIMDSLNSIRFFKDKGDRIILSQDEEIALIENLKFVLNYYKFNEHNRTEIFDLELNLSNRSKDENTNLLNSLSFLANYDLIELRDIKFSKNNRSFYLTDSSSGELSLIFNLLSIAGEIENDSLILIDEPEISLHPEWQSNFLPLLSKMFSNYQRCHFIIATHSPQVLSSTNDKNVYIINLEYSNKLIRSEEISKMSADYQLAYVFKEPGYKNEYLTRIALTTFTNVNKKKIFSEDDINSLDLLLENMSHLDKSDPLHQLILSLKEMRDLYV
ncbi:AAA family ATPase [Acinetobacter baumannii]|uniref:AAA family ATPase n=1 Tax=Acinetobacter baumannii TaxID=470 RepID=UPI003AF4AF3E